MINELKKIKGLKILIDESLLKHTSYKLKEKTKVLVYPVDINQLVKLLEIIKKNSFKFKIIGGGSNLIFEENYDGILISLEELNKCEINDTKITVGAGYSTMKLALKVSRLGLTGMEFATGIPGTIGGAIYNNSGAYKSDMGYIVESILVLTENYELKKIYNKDLKFHYRTSLLKESQNLICLEANIVLKKGNKDEIINVIEDRKQRRIMSQPLEYPSAGSVFRNPELNFAGKLIEEIGYKGKNINGAYVSDKHANFIVNKDSASGKDIVKLINEIKKEVKEKFDIDLVLEQEIVK